MSRNIRWDDSVKKNTLCLVEALLLHAENQFNDETSKTALYVYWVTDRQLQVTGYEKNEKRRTSGQGERPVEVGTRKKHLCKLLETSGQNLELPQLRVRDGYSPRPEKRKLDEIQTALDCLKELGVREDQSAARNKGYWKFTLKLQHQTAAPEENLDVVRRKWNDHPRTNSSERVRTEEAAREEPRQPEDQHLVQRVRQGCCAQIQELYSRIQLLNLRRVDVEQLYVDVYVLEQLSSESYAVPVVLNDRDLGDTFGRLGLGIRQNRPGLEVANKYNRLMVLGKPGSGKSTFLQHLALACCRGDFLNDHIPILIKLRIELQSISHGSPFNLLNAIHQRFERLANREQVERILNEGRFLILLDGFDEVPSQWHRDVQRHIDGFSSQYHKNCFILSCRTRTVGYAFQTFEYVEVAAFNSAQVRTFIQRWFQTQSGTPDEAANLSNQLITMLNLPSNRQVAELAVTPILLSLICSVFSGLRNLPPIRSDLYASGIGLLLNGWNEQSGIEAQAESEIYHKLTVRERQELLSHIADCKFRQEEYKWFQETEILGYIAEHLNIPSKYELELRAVLRAIEQQHGLIIQQARGVYSFSHLTFQEYLTAKKIVTDIESNLENTLEILVSHITDSSWWEVFLLVIPMLSNPDRLLRLMKQYIDALVAADEKLQQLLTWGSSKCRSLLEQVPCNYNVAAVRAFFLDIDHHIDPDRSLAYKVDNVCGIILACTGLFARVLRDELPRAFERAIDPFIRNQLESIPRTDLVTAIAMGRRIALEHAFVFFQPQINRELQTLRRQPPTEEAELFQWLQGEDGRRWAERVANAIGLHRTLSHDWEFNNQQQELLKQYYYANLLLIECLNCARHVSNNVRNNIKNTLLLPIAEIDRLES